MGKTIDLVKVVCYSLCGKSMWKILSPSTGSTTTVAYIVYGLALSGYTSSANMGMRGPAGRRILYDTTQRYDIYEVHITRNLYHTPYNVSPG